MQGQIMPEENFLSFYGRKHAPPNEISLSAHGGYESDGCCQNLIVHERGLQSKQWSGGDKKSVQ